MPYMDKMIIGGTPIDIIAKKSEHATTADSANNATTADSANHATTADNANHATTADSANNATTADSANNANHATTADSARWLTNASRNEIDNSNVHVWTRKDGSTGAQLHMYGYTKNKSFAINKGYGNLYYQDFTIKLPTFFSGIGGLTANVYGAHGCYISITGWTATSITGYIICPINITVNLQILFDIFGW